MPWKQVRVMRTTMTKKKNQWCAIKFQFSLPAPPQATGQRVCQSFLRVCAGTLPERHTLTQDKTQVDQTLFLCVSAHHLFFLFLLHPSPPPSANHLTHNTMGLSISKLLSGLFSKK